MATKTNIKTNANLVFSCLIVEDSKPTREEMRRILEDDVLLNIEPIFEARTVKNALKTIAENEIDFMVLDHSLAGNEMGNTGLDLLKNIPQIDRQIPVVILTSVNKELMDVYKEYMSKIQGWLPKLKQLDKPYSNDIAEDISKTLTENCKEKRQEFIRNSNMILIKSTIGECRIEADFLKKVTLDNQLLTFHFYTDNNNTIESLNGIEHLAEFLRRCPPSIIRISRNVAVNFDKILIKNGNQIRLRGENESHTVGLTYLPKINRLWNL